jgi:alkylated DNA repair dioxygenase AlkB
MPITIVPCEHFNECHSYTLDAIQDPLDMMNRIIEEVEFTTGEVIVFGKAWEERRLTSLHGESTGVFNYSNKDMKILPLTPVLVELQDIVKMHTGTHYDTMLLNLYRTGNDKIGLHADKVKGMDNTDISSVSLGAERTFRVKNNAGQTVFSEKLESGSLFRMTGTFQQRYKHEVPQEKRICEKRLNITLRVSSSLTTK